MEEKPHILILGTNTKRGKHTFNFNKYTVRLNYQFNYEGIIIEMFPPSKKKQIDYNNFVSPYGEEESLQRSKSRNIIKRNKKDKGNGRKAKKQNKENEGKSSQKPVKNGKDNQKNEIMKKCTIQEVFNFSEVPDAIERFFPYEGPTQVNQGTVARKPKNPSLRDVRSRVSFNKSSVSSSLGMKVSKKSDFDFFMRSRQSLNHFRSGKEICSDRSECSLNNQNSVVRLQKKLGKLERENQTLQKKLSCAYRPFL